MRLIKLGSWVVQVTLTLLTAKISYANSLKERRDLVFFLYLGVSLSEPTTLFIYTKDGSRSEWAYEHSIPDLSLVTTYLLGSYYTALGTFGFF